MARLIPLALLGGVLMTTLAFDGATAQNCDGNRNMCDALSYLQQARASLERADSNKGGYHLQAMNTVDRAIQQVRAGIRYSHGR
jgi:hypothetical protein